MNGRFFRYARIQNTAVYFQYSIIRCYRIVTLAQLHSAQITLFPDRQQTKKHTHTGLVLKGTRGFPGAITSKQALSRFVETAHNLGNNRQFIVRAVAADS